MLLCLTSKFRAICGICCAIFFFDEAEHLRDEICRQIAEKVEKMNNRELFSQYKQASGSDREQLRNAYLDQRGIRSAFRSNEEWHDQPPPGE